MRKMLLIKERRGVRKNLLVFLKAEMPNH
jgi:hypothetical protein